MDVDHSDGDHVWIADGDRMVCTWCGMDLQEFRWQQLRDQLEEGGEHAPL